MKCDTCKFSCGESASMEYPYPWVYCAKGHWDGAGEDGMDYEGEDYWASCKDFEEKK